MRMHQVVASIVTLALSAGIAYAGGGTALTYQGRLLNAGEPANGLFNVDFNLWDDPVVGIQIGSTIMFNDLPISDGLFTVELDFGANAFDTTDRGREVTVNGTERTPRQPITRAPYSIQTRGMVIGDDGNVLFNSMSASEGTVTFSSIGGIDMILDADTNNVGENHNARIVLRQDGGQVVSRMGYREAANTLEIMQEYSSNLILGTNNEDRLTILANGNVGVGTTNPSARLNVVGDGSGTASWFTNTGVGHAIIAEQFGSSRALNIYAITSNEAMRVQNDGTGKAATFVGDVEFANGNVGIGTTAPNYTLHVVSSTGSRAIYGHHTAASGFRYGVYGRSDSTSCVGVFGQATANSGVTYGVIGQSNSPDGYGVYSNGDCHVEGTLSKSGGAFKIDHPLDPQNKYLQHSFVESPDMMNVYNGNVILDENGKAYVGLPDYFNELNRDFRYQLTPMGAAMPNLHISQEIANNWFGIAGGQAGMKVSWQVTGIRQDPWAQAHRIEVEPYKRPEHQGKYLNPELYGQPKEMGVHYFPDEEHLMAQTPLAKAQAGPTPNPSTGGTK